MSQSRATGQPPDAPQARVLGAKVVLRPVVPDDYPRLVEWQNDAEIAHWMDYRTPFSLRDVEADQERARREGVAFVIEHEGRPVGKCGLNQFRRQSAVCSLYIYVGDREVWNRGLARDAVLALLAHAFERHGLEHVELTMLADNARARRVYEACGFVTTGVLRGRSYRGGEWIRTEVMRVDRAQFLEAREQHAG